MATKFRVAGTLHGERRDWQPGSQAEREREREREEKKNAERSKWICRRQARRCARGLTRGKLTKFVNCVCFIVADLLAGNRAHQATLVLAGTLLHLHPVFRERSPRPLETTGRSFIRGRQTRAVETKRPLLRGKVAVLAENSGIGRLPREINSRQSRCTQLSAWSTQTLVSRLIGLAIAIESFRSTTTARAA